MQPYRVEIEEVMLFNMKTMMAEGKRVEIETLEGIFKAFRYMLKNNDLKEEELKELYIAATVGIVEIQDVKTHKIIKQSLLLLKEHWELFDKFIINNEEYLKNKLLALVRHRNRKVKESACECFESFITYISNRENSNHQRGFVRNFVAEIKQILRRSLEPVEIMVCIRCYGILSKSVSLCFGQ